MAVQLSASPISRFADATFECSARPAEIQPLIATLAVEMAERWRRGERPVAEEFLSRHPSLWAQPEVAARLIYEEICLRQECGQEHASIEVAGRFPQWQAELEALLCRRPGGVSAGDVRFPEVGDQVAGFRLLAQLGCGARGRVFLASQRDLADRPVVLKITTREGGEHLSLARLQHTHIVPLYSAQEDLDRNLRILCLPYFGGATLARLLERLRSVPPAARSGQHLLRAIDEAPAGQPASPPARGPARQFLAQASYVQAICWIGSRLADALQYAHERDLVHLDLKPSNVLLAADGQPMLLDFHLARAPLPRDSAPEWLGGTPAFMSPEQLAALKAFHERRPAPQAVDGRSDIYSLGLVLRELLEGTGQVPPEAEDARGSRNPNVSAGLADVIAKCLKQDPADRYADAGTLASDLRRHLADLPLRGVPNRSLAERWSKWRRRKPHALRVVTLAFGFLLAALSVAGYVFLDQSHKHLGPETALSEGRVLCEAKRYDEAIATLDRGLRIAETIPFTEGLRQELRNERRFAQRAQATQQLHQLADRIRLCSSADSLLTDGLRNLEGLCQAAWQARDTITESISELPSDERQRIEIDLLDLAILGADLRVRRAAPADVSAARQQALRTLTEAEALFGPSHALHRERRVHAEALGLSDVAKTAAADASRLPPRAAWEHCALGRSLLAEGKAQAAAAAFREAVRSEPAGLWPNYYLAVAAYRLGNFNDAVDAFSVCIGAAGKATEQTSPFALAGCFYNRGRAYAAAGRLDQAEVDYDQALRLKSDFGPAVFNRAVLRYEQQRHTEALADLERALEAGVDAASVHYHRALVHQQAKDHPAARAELRRALEIDPHHKEARTLQDQLRRPQ